MANMGDKEKLTDGLTAQKFISGTYNICAGECVSTELRSAMLSILNDEHAIQNDIFTEMSKRGFYKTTPAPQTEIDQVKQKFSI